MRPALDEVRTKRNLSCAPNTQYEAMVSGSLAGVYVTAVDANTTLKVMINKVTHADVQAYAKKYAGKMQLVMLGDPSKLDPALGASF